MKTSGRPLVFKFGGELIEDASRLKTAATALAAVARTTPLVVIHGGGREIDAALKRTGIEPQQVDGLRITDAATLDVVVAVLAGAVNTRFVAALNTAGVAAVGLTGADAKCGLSQRAPAHRRVDGRTVDLGHVGVPTDRADARLLTTLLGEGFVPVVASIGIGDDGQLFNVNADTLAGFLAARLGAHRLVIAGTTPGVLDGNGQTVALLESSAIAQMVTSGTATAGMIAKLRACERALAGGVGDVLIVDGRDPAAIEAAIGGRVPASATRVIAMESSAALSGPRHGQ
ncbi:MAG: acetylglutamate kinase [Acidobacteria bacterium]|nr:MAG: acetylglutamate kinase [Acidobacteriota bacterium]